MKKRILAVMTVIGTIACGGGGGASDAASRCRRPRAVPRRRPTAAPADRKYLLERVDEAAVVQLYADGFRDLTLKDKTLVWHLYQAAIAGRDIFYDQKYAHNLEMRDVLEAIITHPAGVDPKTLEEITALHEAVLDQHRSVQQPDRAQVRAAVHAGGLRGGRARRRESRRRRSRSGAARRSISSSRGSSRCSSIPTSIRRSPRRRRRRGRTSSRPAPTICTSA